MSAPRKNSTSFMKSKRSMATSMMTSRMSMMTSRYRYNRKQLFNNTIKENPTTTTQPSKVQIFDKNGNDVTPLPMINQNKSSTKLQKNGSNSSQSDVSLSSSTKEQSYTEYLSFFESQLTKSYSMISQIKPSESLSQSSKIPLNSIGEKNESTLSSDSENEITDEKSTSSFYLLSKDANKKKEVNPNKRIYITLTETPTVCLYDMQNKIIFSDTPGAKEVQEENSRYQQLLLNKKNNDNFVEKISQTFNNDPKEKDMQTENIIKTNEQVQANVWDIYDNMKLLEQQANQNDDFLDYYDSTLDKNDGTQESIDNMTASLNANTISESSLTQHSSMMLNSSTLGKSMFQTEMNSDSINNSSSVMASAFESSMLTSIQNKSSNDSSDKPNTIAVSLSSLNQENILNSLHIMECAVVSNNYYDLLVEYRDLPSLKVAQKVQAPKKVQKKSISTITSDDEDDDDENDEEADEIEEILEETDKNLTNFFLDAQLPSLPFLWSYKCDLSRGRNISQIAWNKKCEDIIAVSYEELKTTNNANSPKGLILCWSLKNAEYPSRVYKLDTPVTTIDFSLVNPNLLAAGFMDGRVVIFDIRSKSNIPVLENHENGGKHNDPVWDMKWVERERILGDEQSKGEILMTISTDGRVIQWNLKHGLEFTELMFLKRVTEQDLPDRDRGDNNAKLYKKKKIPSFISRLSGGLCFDFNSKDSNIYLAGTEDGVIHKCSCSYSEQYLQSYFGHSGPVYKIRWSPFLPNIFLTCSSDWTIRLWSQDEEEYIFKFENEKDTITDIQWSPMCSTVFGAVTNNGRIEIWDLSFSILDPIIVHQVMDRKLTCINFSKSYPVVLISDNEGNVNIYKLKNFNHLSNKSTSEQVDLLQNIIIHRNEISSIQNNNNNNTDDNTNENANENTNDNENDGAKPDTNPNNNDPTNETVATSNDNNKDNTNKPDGSITTTAAPPTTTTTTTAAATTTNVTSEVKTEMNTEPIVESNQAATEAN